MSKSFNKFKSKVRAQSVASSLFLGLGASAIALAVMMTVFKLTGKAVPMFAYAILAGGAAVLTAVLYLIFMPNDKALAKRLDSVYSLDEKVSTMIELRDQEGGFVQLQREDAERRLSEQPTKQLKSRQLVAGILVFFIAIGAVLGACLIPAAANTEAPIDDFDKQWIITALGEIIDIVKGSYSDDTLKEATLAELESLLTFVKSSSLLSEMKTEAIKTVIAINQHFRTANSAEAIAKHFTDSKDKDIAALGKALAELSGSGSKDALITLGETLSKDTSDDASFKADEINAYLHASGVRTSDGLYILFKSLITAVKSDNSKADESFEDAAKTLGSTVIVQNVNKSTISIVINKLCNLFGITEDDVREVAPDSDITIGAPSDGGDTGSDPDDDDTNTSMGTGGLGSGNVIYGSNDLIFDPFTNTYRPYGEIINEYFAKANEQITDGKTTQDVSDAAEEYFGALFGNTEKKN